MGNSLTLQLVKTCNQDAWLCLRLCLPQQTYQASDNVSPGEVLACNYSLMNVR